MGQHICGTQALGEPHLIGVGRGMRSAHRKLGVFKAYLSDQPLKNKLECPEVSVSEMTRPLAYRPSTCGPQAPALRASPHGLSTCMKCVERGKRQMHRETWPLHIPICRFSCPFETQVRAYPPHPHVPYRIGVDTRPVSVVGMFFSFLVCWFWSSSQHPIDTIPHTWYNGYTLTQEICHD